MWPPCGQEAFLDLMLPVVSATIKHFEAAQQQASGLDPRVRKALRRRQRMKTRPRAQSESDAVFKVCTRQLQHPVDCSNVPAGQAALLDELPLSYRGLCGEESKPIADERNGLGGLTVHTYYERARRASRRATGGSPTSSRPTLRRRLSPLRQTRKVILP